MNRADGDQSLIPVRTRPARTPPIRGPGSARAISFPISSGRSPRGCKGKPSVTGLHGAELRHSVDAAYEALLHAGPALGISVAALQTRRFAVHLVNIAEPKDGPSAGLAIALAMISAATGRPVRRKVAVTGELSVHGNVNAVGGVPEKLSAAARHGRSRIVIPAENASELGRLSELAMRLEIHPIRTLGEALDLVLEDRG